MRRIFKPGYLKGKKRNSRTPTSKKRYIKFLLVLAGLVLIGLIISFIKSGFFEIKNIRIKSTLTCTNQNDLQRRLSQTVGKNYFSINQKKVEEQILKEFPCVSSLTFKNGFFKDFLLNIFSSNKYVNVFITERKPIAQINLITQKLDLIDLKALEATSSSSAGQLNFQTDESSVSGIFLADNLNYIFSKNEDKSLPQVFLISGNLSIGQKLPPGMLQDTLEILKKLNELSVEVKTARIESGQLLIDGSQKLIFSLNKDINYQLASLQLILQKAKMESKLMEKIDLRFDKPVVVYSPKKK